MLMLLNKFNPNAQFGEAGGYQTVGDVIANGLPMFFMGILTVFAVLILLWFALELFHKACYREQDEKPASEAPATQPAPAPAAPVVSATDDLELVAVIAAAIAAAQAEAPNGEFRVVSFRRK